MGQSIEAIRARLAAATPGRWSWDGCLKFRELHLIAATAQGSIVMDFVRWGMSAAAPRFRGEHFDMRRVDELDLVQSRRRIDGINHPDAILIEHATRDIAFLLAEVDRLQARVAEMEGGAS